MPAATVTNNATGVLASNIASGAASLTLQTGQGAKFPTIAGSDYFWATLVDAGNNIEIVKCTAHTAASDTFTITRAQQGTTAQAYLAGDRFEMRVTSEHFNEKVSKSGDTMTGPLVLPGNPSSNLQAAPKQYVDSAVGAVDLSSRVAKTGDTMTGNLSAPSMNATTVPISGTGVVNVNYYNANLPKGLRIDTTAPIEVSMYAIAFKATNGSWYIIYSVARTSIIDQPFFGLSGGAGNIAAGGPTQIIEIPKYVEGKGPNNYTEVILSTDANEVIAVAYEEGGNAVATGLAGSGHFGISTTVDQARWRLIWDYADITKPYFGQTIAKVLTNNRGLALAETNTTFWVLTNSAYIWAAGEGATGALGRGSTTDFTVWQETQWSAGNALSFIQSAWCPVNTTSPVILCRDYFGLYYALGAGGSGICGGGVVTNRTFWTQIPELPGNNVVKVMFAGINLVMDCYFLFDTGELWGAGRNLNGSLGTGTTTIQNTYAIRATDVADFWIGGSNYSSAGSNTTWIKKTDGTLHTTGVASYHQVLSGTTTQKTTFSAATNIPAGMSLDTVWHGCAEGQAFFYSRWTDGYGDYKICSVGYSGDGNRGNETVSQTTLTDLTSFIAHITHPTDIAFMQSFHVANANRKGASILVTTDGQLYALGRTQPSSDGGTTWVASPYPHRYSPQFTTIFTKVNMGEFQV